ncbi:MAG: TetR/AcrR family transcriptional regulator [Deltaproteobacteria bacterium]|nr:TetR/AcrR family transcriptional regulator [Nannocystaceae bacterium]
MAKRLSRSEAQARTRERLLAAAAEVVARKGSAASVRDIAEAAGFSQGALYANFAGKDEILVELLRRHMSDSAAGMTALLEGQHDAVEALAAIERWAGSIGRAQDWAAVAVELQLQARRSPAFAARYEEVMAGPLDAMGSVLRKLFKISGVKPGVPVRDLSRALLAMAHGLALDRGGGEPSKVVMLVLRALILSRTERT